MTFGQESPDGGGGAGLRWRLRPLRPLRYVLGAAAVVLLVLVVTGALSPLLALGAAAVVLIAALWGSRTGPSGSTILPSHGAARTIGAESTEAPPASLIADIIAGLPDPVIALDRDGTVIAANGPARAVVPALRRSEPASLALRMPAIVDAIRRAAATGEPQRAEFSERVPADRWFEAHVIPTSLHPARNGLILLTLHDLTPLRRVEEMRADFVANASHELRTPLAALSGFIDTLQGPARDDSDARERFLAIMKQQAWRMARLIDDLLSLSRIELNAHVHPETLLELAPVVRQVVDSLQTLAQERDVEVTITAAEPLTVRGERDELIRVFENLVENALKYGGAGKRVDIVLERAGTSDAANSEARVCVRDYGPGIAPEHLPRLTERFYRVDVGHSRAEGGTGLGLALVKHTLNRHRGRLLIESRHGEGATFTVCLPLVDGLPNEP